ncbi:MAG TPA: endonuclease [Bacteroidales bacterium]|nr:endonuclease [Bacteroidales bacterium]
MKNLEKGFSGENIAIEYLEKKGYKILARNWHSSHKEVDIIAEYNLELIIVEVKTRTSNYFQEPENSVSRKKQKFLIDATEKYIEKYNIDKNVRFDIISIIQNEKEMKINHIENAFAPNF